MAWHGMAGPLKPASVLSEETTRCEVRGARYCQSTTAMRYGVDCGASGRPSLTLFPRASCSAPPCRVFPIRLVHLVPSRLKLADRWSLVNKNTTEYVPTSHSIPVPVPVSVTLRLSRLRTNGKSMHADLPHSAFKPPTKPKILAHTSSSSHSHESGRVSNLSSAHPGGTHACKLQV